MYRNGTCCMELWLAGKSASGTTGNKKKRCFSSDSSKSVTTQSFLSQGFGSFIILSCNSVAKLLTSIESGLLARR